MTASIKHILSGAIFVMAGVATFTALAQTPPPASPASTGAPGATTASPGKAKPRLKDLDTNHDRMISRDEARGRPRLARNFDAIDTNKDGQLSRDELKAYRQAHRGERK
jgi:hypothetical protein